MSEPGMVLVLAAGDPGTAPEPPPHEMVIAADSGLDLAESLGVRVDLVVGDMDSVSPPALQRAERNGTAIQRHPRDKDETDLELAIAAAVSTGTSSVHVIVGAGGRVDHAIANLAVLASPKWTGVAMSATVGDSDVWVVRGSRALPVAVGGPLSLLPIGGTASGVHTTGLRWELHGDDLGAHSTRGVSNVVETAPVMVSVGEGVLLAISSPTPPSGHGAARG